MCYAAFNTDICVPEPKSLFMARLLTRLYEIDKLEIKLGFVRRHKGVSAALATTEEFSVYSQK